jgi:hypothetical protein
VFDVVLNIEFSLLVDVQRFVRRQSHSVRRYLLACD